MIVLVVVFDLREDLASRVGATNGADPMRTARAVAARALVHRWGADAVLGAARRRAGMRLLFLRNGHRR